MMDAFYTRYDYGMSIHKSQICYHSHADAKVGDFMQKKYKLKVVISICETQIKMISFVSIIDSLA